MINAMVRRIKLDYPNTKSEKIIMIIKQSLNKREREILSYRFPWTQEEVGKVFELSKERIRAIEANVFNKIIKKLNER